MCGAPAGHQPLCAACIDDLPVNRSACSRCALPLPEAGICGHCQRRPPPFAAAVSLLRWQAPVDWLVHSFKYQARLDLGVLFARLLAEQLSAGATPLPDLIVPTPLHPSRLRHRGFNQALEVGRGMAKHLNLPLLPSALRRTRATVTQTGLSPRERRRNIRAAFAVDRRIEASLQGRRVALLDDVLTTGSTAAEMTRTLRRAGVAQVLVWTIARSGHHRQQHDRARLR